MPIDAGTSTPYIGALLSQRGKSTLGIKKFRESALGHVTCTSRKISAIGVEKSVGIGCLRGRHA